MDVRWTLLLAVITTVLPLHVHADEKALGCDEGWDNSLGNCYYVDNTRKVTWPQAQNECNRRDASPMFFESQDELNWYMNTIKSYPSSAYWTGLNDIVNKDPSAPGTGTWKWGSYEYANMSLIKWSKSPGNDGRALCGGINLNGKMYDADCNSQQGYICNIDNGDAGGGCPFGWLPTPTDCYYVSNTTDPSQLITWSQAKDKCVSLNSQAHLITIDDVNDQTFISGQLPYLSQTTVLHWTGLQGNGQAGGWKWFNGATFSQQLFSWATEPDGVAGKENCAVIRYNGKFSDRGCNTPQNYICKKPEIYTDTTFNLGCGLWTRANKKCYVFYSAPASPWLQAKQTCLSMGGDLINVKDVDIKTWLIEQMLDPANGDLFFWTALNDRDTEGTFKWGDGSVLDTSTITWNHEPNDWKGNEDCAIILGNGQYNDVLCSHHSAPLCEVDSVQSCPTKGGNWVSRPADTGNGLNCYLFGNYKNKTARQTQPEAQDYCRSLANQITLSSGLTQTQIPKLYSADTASEKKFVNQQLLNYVDNQFGFWTALSDAQTEGFWTYGNVQADPSLIDWHKEPSATTPDSDCVFVSYGANFIVQKCSAKMGYICERPANFVSAAGKLEAQVYVLLVLTSWIYSVL